VCYEAAYHVRLLVSEVMVGLSGYLNRIPHKSDLCTLCTIKHDNNTHTQRAIFRTGKRCFISSHGIAMPKGLYFAAVIFLSFFFFLFFDAYL